MTSTTQVLKSLGPWCLFLINLNVISLDSAQIILRSVMSHTTVSPHFLSFHPFHPLYPVSRFMYRVKVGENLFAEASAPSKKAARQLAAEEAVKELMSDGRLQLNKVWSEKWRMTAFVNFTYCQNECNDFREAADHFGGKNRSCHLFHVVLPLLTPLLSPPSHHYVSFAAPVAPGLLQ